jgi:hypothetical protein
MRPQVAILLFATTAFCQSPVPQFSPRIPADDAICNREFYRLAAQIQDQIWPDWDRAPAPVILVTEDGEFLTHDLSPPHEFTKLGDDLYARPRKVAVDFLATFPLFGPPSVIVVGEPKNTESKTSTPWLMAVMHEHFHQLQFAQPEYDKGVEGLGLSSGDRTGMWMLNYPYEEREIVQSFGHLRSTIGRRNRERRWRIREAGRAVCR